jgi:hypothetical protein
MMLFATDPATRQAFITGLRALADYLDRHQAVPVPRYGHEIHLSADRADHGGCGQVNEFARQLGVAAPQSINAHGHYHAVRLFGPVGYGMAAISDHAMALHDAAETYYGCVTPDTWT